MCDALMCGRRFRTFNIVDDFNREVLAIEIDLNLPAQRVIRVLERVVAWRGLPAKLRMDNGPEFISRALADWAEKIRCSWNLSSQPSQHKIHLLSDSIELIAQKYWICMRSKIYTK